MKCVLEGELYYDSQDRNGKPSFQGGNPSLRGNLALLNKTPSSRELTPLTQLLQQPKMIFELLQRKLSAKMVSTNDEPLIRK